MPQLNLAPWFMVFMLVWMTLIMFITKITNTNPNPYLLAPQYKNQPNNYYWTWPWP